MITNWLQYWLQTWTFKLRLFVSILNLGWITLSRLRGSASANNWTARHWQITIFCSTLSSNNCFIIRSQLFLMNIFGKRSDLPFPCKSYRKKEKSVVSFAHEQNAICSHSQTKMDDIAHEQTIIWRQLFGLSAYEKQEKFAANDNKSYLQARYFLSNKLDSLVFPFYSWGIVLSLINEICHGQRITLLLALEYCSWSVVNKMYLLTLPGDRWCGILAGLL